MEELASRYSFRLGVAQHRALAVDNHDRLAPEPVAHLREWVPEVSVVNCASDKRIFIYGLRFKIACNGARQADQISPAVVRGA